MSFLWLFLVVDSLIRGPDPQEHIMPFLHVALHCRVSLSGDLALYNIKSQKGVRTQSSLAQFFYVTDYNFRIQNSILFKLLAVSTNTRNGLNYLLLGVIVRACAYTRYIRPPFSSRPGIEDRFHCPICSPLYILTLSLTYTCSRWNYITAGIYNGI